ncbi:Hypothetical Protein FCC1311_110072 [Hondaea fermentalgiana]|uniref:Glutamine amidotransferase type-2 domain-containing protein n=1 Tax=Hondaea fermentalgiana TaxID=2315210 RepID=A0A2R5GW37_9STRA|nr:Hypothetical Protein FCC1311_110072 [Hondaea fermentalgiana]|eukprot:GBG34785.1 Hypothetical Protein FCC1311_110072 [Hondaea fermentalgiana]
MKGLLAGLVALGVLGMQYGMCDACRWALAASHAAPIRAEMIATETSHALATQAWDEPHLPKVAEGKFYTAKEIFDNQWKHVDGWGVGAYDPETLKPRRYRSSDAAVNDTAPHEVDAAFLASVRNTTSQMVMTHVRASSAGEPEESNSHPFVFGQLLWMHHGGCPDHDALQDVLKEEGVEKDEHADGVTDSEYIGALFAHYLADDLGDADASAAQTLAERTEFSLDELRNALYKTVQRIQKLSDEADAPSSLNFAVSDGRHLVATRYRTSDEDPPTLYYSLGSDWDPALEQFSKVSMPVGDAHVLRGETLLVASEPLSKNEDAMRTWQPLIKDQMLSYDLEDVSSSSTQVVQATPAPSALEGLLDEVIEELAEMHNIENVDELRRVATIFFESADKEDFIFNFDDIWPLAGYTLKGNAKRAVVGVG